MLGGAPANFSCHAAELGAESFLVSAVGDDSLGEEAITKLNRHQVYTDYVHRNKHPTGTVKIDLAAGEPSYCITQNVAWDFCRWSSRLAALTATLDAVCFGTLFQRSPVGEETVRKFLSATKPECFRIFDVNLRQKFYSSDVILESLKHANVLKLNNDELPIIAKAVCVDSDQNTFLKTVIQKYDLKLVALTCGADGSYLTTPTQHDFCPATPTEVVSTVGAGDAFTASLTMGMLNKLPIKTINKMASKLAAKICAQSGAVT